MKVLAITILCLVLIQIINGQDDYYQGRGRGRGRGRHGWQDENRGGSDGDRRGRPGWWDENRGGWDGERRGRWNRHRQQNRCSLDSLHAAVQLLGGIPPTGFIPPITGPVNPGGLINPGGPINPGNPGNPGGPTNPGGPINPGNPGTLVHPGVAAVDAISSYLMCMYARDFRFRGSQLDDPSLASPGRGDNPRFPPNQPGTGGDPRIIGPPIRNPNDISGPGAVGPGPGGPGAVGPGPGGPGAGGPGAGGPGSGGP